MRQLLKLLVLLLLPAFSFAGPSLQYEPAVVQLTGKVSSGKFQHPNGDWVTFFTLTIPEPVSINADPANPTNIAESDITQVQLFAPSAGLQKALKAKAGKSARVKGSLFHAHTAWHRRPLVMSVSAVE
ncbi:MAG: DUF4431 domain-containing protein [Polaromonas sp.]|nr:DUF4431 domain-containing protein [Polaromonas sp.]